MEVETDRNTERTLSPHGFGTTSQFDAVVSQSSQPLVKILKVRDGWQWWNMEKCFYLYCTCVFPFSSKLKSLNILGLIYCTNTAELGYLANYMLYYDLNYPSAYTTNVLFLYSWIFNWPAYIEIWKVLYRVCTLLGPVYRSGQYYVHPSG